jgi:hypothetical protein
MTRWQKKGLRGKRKRKRKRKMMNRMIGEWAVLLFYYL